MRELTAVCFVIASLALANGQASTKTYEYSDKDLIHSDRPFANNKLSYGVCEGSDLEKKCKIYQESISDENSAARTCDVNLKYNVDSPNVNLLNAGKDRVILTVKDDSKNVKLVVVNLAGCSVKEASIVTDVTFSVAVVPKDDSYDVVFENNEICKGYVCKATYDYEGKVVKEAAAFGVKSAKNSLAVDAANQGFLVGEHEDAYGPIKVYFVGNGDKDAKVLYSTPDGSNRELYTSSTEEGKLSFCALIGRKLVCQQYDAEGKTKNLEIEKPITIGTYDAIDALNLEKGLLVLWIEHPMRGNGQPPANVAKYDERGETIKSLSVDLNCREGGYSVPKLYKNSVGEYCVSAVCRQYLSPPARDSKFSRSTKCFAKSEL